MNVTDFDHLLSALTPAACEEYLRGRGWVECREHATTFSKLFRSKTLDISGHDYIEAALWDRPTIRLASDMLDAIARAESRSPLSILADLVGPAAMHEAFARAVGAGAKERCIKLLRELNHGPDGDHETSHQLADAALCGLLRELGFEDVVREWNKIEKWYA